MPNSTKDGMISKNISPIMIFVCFRTKSNMRNFSSKKTKRRTVCSPLPQVVVGADGLEPPTYAL